MTSSISTVAAARRRLGWSQQELARKAGVTRQLVATIESDRHTPNVNAAIRLARALATSVEELFGPPGEVVSFSGRPLAPGTPVIAAQVGDSTVVVPLEPLVASQERWAVSDAITTEEGLAWMPGASHRGLLIAGCDPALGLLAELVQRAGNHQITVVHASTGRAVEALARGHLHGAVVHGPSGELPPPPTGVRRFHLASWQVGLAAPAEPPTVESLVARQGVVVQREPHAGSQAAFARALAAVGAESLAGPVAEGHVAVARRVAEGGGDAGITMESAARVYRLGFRPLEVHLVELWLDDRWTSRAETRSLLDQLTSGSFRQRAAHLGGYDLSNCGTEVRAG
jgi:DNA-binding XRE family transcriptional regulator